jgi:ABC-type uncharacterized transport system substrate-binding protein
VQQARGGGRTTPALERLALGAPALRRDFIALTGGVAALAPLAARAQQPERMRRIGVLMASAADEPESQVRIAAFAQGLAQLGWADGRNVRIETRWATTNPDDIRRHAAELAALAPDVILAGTGTATVAPLLQATHTVPIVFALVIDPVGAGFVASKAPASWSGAVFRIERQGQRMVPLMALCATLVLVLWFFRH